MSIKTTPNGFQLDDSGQRVVVDPVTRIEGHMRCEVNIDDDMLGNPEQVRDLAGSLDLGGHVGQLELGGLEVEQGLAELLAFLGVVERQLERALVFLFIMMDQPAAVGFLITAKSIFRFGDIREHRQMMLAEYIIIGTLMSFAYGIFLSYLTKILIEMI